MNREIKFRAWIQESAKLTDFDDMYYSSDYASLSEFFAEVERARAESNKVTVMQFTGLTDKNGKEIYEADAIRWDDENIIVGSPRWYVCDAYCEYGYHNLGSFRDDYSREDEPSRAVREGEVISNIYENPDLLPT